MFRVVIHPSSGAHITESAVSDINEIVIAICRGRGWFGSGVGVLVRVHLHQLYVLCGGVAACHAATPPHNIQRRSFYRILT